MVEGAHIWPVADIKRAHYLSMDSKIECATDGDNGIWACENHHKMLDEDLLNIDLSGIIKCRSDLEKNQKNSYVSQHR